MRHHRPRALTGCSARVATAGGPERGGGRGGGGGGGGGGPPHPRPMQLKVLYHGNCFDGCASAALFTARFFGEREGTRLSEVVAYRPLHHQQGDPFPQPTPSTAT